MKTFMSPVLWVQLPQNQQRLSGGSWQERCYPFRGVLPEKRAENAVELRRVLDDCWLALQEFEQEFEDQVPKQARTSKGEIA
ncbi:hypothetical protein [Trichlorobacter lovleyi]|uniref:hypothetical protein n=1 Tax=Trichlorobacter lovleyi TaxID=313985 RepID=UPI00247FD995|nr:hypothetical protein [Trichlorobacter lovleyi]